MPTEYDNNGSTHIQTGVSLLRTAAGLTPLAASAWYGINSISANKPLVKPLAKSGRNINVGKSIGAAGVRVRRAREKAAHKAVESIRESLNQGLSKSEELNKIIGKVEQHNALLQTMSLTLESASAGLDTQAVQSLKQDIANVMSNASPGSTEELARSVVNTLLQTNSDELMLQWKQNMDEFSNVADQLEVPNFGHVRSGHAYNPVQLGSLQGAEEARASRLRGILGQDAQMRLYRSKSGVDANALVAQIYSRGGRYQRSVPISGGGVGGHFFRSGQSFNTTYSMPRFALDMQEASRVVGQSGGDHSFGAMQAGGAVRAMPDHYIGMVGKYKNQGDFAFNKLGEAMRETMITVDVAALNTSGRFGSHIPAQTALKSNAVHTFNYGRMSGTAAVDLTARIARSAGLDPGTTGAKRLLVGHGDKRFGTIGMLEGSVFSGLQGSYGSNFINRTTVPITARESQISGRMSLGADDVFSVGHMKIGAVDSASMAHGIGHAGIGGTNRYMVMDFKKKGKLYQDVSGWGMAFSGSKTKQWKSSTISVLDPRIAADNGHTYMTSKLMNQIMQAGDAGVTHTGEQLWKQYYMGQAGNTAKMTSADPAAIERFYKFMSSGKSSGKSMIKVSEQQLRELDFAKVFSMSFKGNVVTRDRSAIDHIYNTQDKRLLQHEQAMIAAGIGDKSLRYRAVHTSADMAKKGSGMLIHQIAGVSRMHGIGYKQLKSAASAIQNPLFDTGYGRYAEAAFDLMRSKGVNAAAIGSMLTGVYHGAGSASLDDNQIKQLENMVNIGFGGKETLSARAAIGAMRSGIVSFVDTGHFGETKGDWRAGRAGAESRFAKTSYERLRTLGLDAERASGVVGNIYSKKVGMGKHLTMAEEMFKMARSLGGQRNFIDAYGEKDLPRIKYGQLPDTLQNQPFSKWLRNQAGGAVIDFSDAPSHIERSIQQTFGHNSLYFPGTRAFEASSGTMIKQAGGATKDISGQFGRFIDSFWGRIQNNESIVVADELRKSLGLWREEGLDMTARTIAGLGRGKLSGSSSPRVRGLNLSTALGYNSKQQGVMAQLFTGTGGTAVMGDSNYMLNELAAQKGASRKDLVRQARMFFTGMEHAGAGNIGKAHGSGLIRLMGRDPVMGSGNVFIGQVFRNIDEVSSLGGSDEFFQNVLNRGFMRGGELQKGQSLMQSFFGKDIQSFSEIAAQGRSTQNKFFNAMIDNLSRFTGGEGGGVATVLGIKAFTDGSNEVLRDVGMAPQAHMDADGDTVKSVVLNADDSSTIRNLLSNTTPEQLADELRFRTMADRFGDVIKGGIVDFSEKKFGTDPKDTIAEYEDIRKELGISQQTGAMDTRLRPLHEAFMSHGDEGMLQRIDRQFLASLEEHVLLKAKHMKRYSPVADIVGKAVYNVVGSPGEKSKQELFDVLRKYVFSGQDESISMGRFDVSTDFGGVAGTEIKNILSSTHNGETVWDLQGFVDRAADSSRSYRSSGGDMLFTPGQLSARMKNDPGAIIDLLNSKSMEAAALSEASSSVQPAKIAGAFKAFRSNLSNLDVRMTAPLAIGAGLSMLAMGALGGDGYSATPLSMPGEYADSQVESAIASGGLFGGRDPVVEPTQEIADGSITTPINTGTTYAQRPGAYSIRGQVQNLSGLSETRSYIQHMIGGAGSGSIRINDQRRPLTSSYQDRLLGFY